jgi:hypothetical protein
LAPWGGEVILVVAAAMVRADGDIMDGGVGVMRELGVTRGAELAGGVVVAGRGVASGGVTDASKLEDSN